MLLIAGCAGLPERSRDLAACERVFAATDAAVAAAGLRDAQAAPVPGFAYLRVNRFLASFRHELTEDQAVAAWAGRLRDLDMRARRIELHKLHDAPERGQALAARLDACGARLLRADLADPTRRERLRRRATVPDAYRDGARLAGLYPLAVPFLQWGISDWHGQTLEAFGQEPPADAEVAIHAPAREAVPSATEVAAWLAEARRADALGIPELPPARLRALARRHAPVWEVAVGGDHDRIGVPVRDDDVPGVDPSRAVTYVETGYTRFDGAVLLQLGYTVWFDRRPAESALDPLAGALDGLVWRVTLDADGRPLLADSIHPCGCYHQFFPGERLARRGRESFWQEPPLVPARLPPGPAQRVRLASGSHYVRDVTPAAAAPGAARYRLRPYAQLRERHLFASDGLVPGSERWERWFLWPSGVRSPGAMRQSGHHATAFVGKRHFDDPFLIGRHFRREGASPSD